MWSRYQDELVRAYDAACDPADAEELRNSAEARASQRFTLLRQAPKATVDNVVAAETDALKGERLNAMTEAEFRAFTSSETLRAALIQRHTFDPLASFQMLVDRLRTGP